jgi:hypothetical protein
MLEEIVDRIQVTVGTLRNGPQVILNCHQPSSYAA